MSNLAELALNTATLGHNLDGYGAGWSIEQIVDACAERGIGGIVFWRRELSLDGAGAIGRRVRAAGLKVAGLCRTPFLVGPQALPTQQAIIDDCREAIDMAAALEAPVLTIVVGGVEPGTTGLTESLKRVQERVALVAPYAAACGVKLALEPLNPVYGGNRSCLVTLRDALNLCDELNFEHIGVAVDIYHVWWDSTLETQIQRAGSDRLFGFHLCDWLADTSDVLLDRGMMGDGVADIVGITRMVDEIGYSGFREVEIFSANDWWLRDPDEVLDTVVRRFSTTTS